MQSRATTVDAYLAELPAVRRAALQAVRRVILDNLDPVYTEGMQYGMIGYAVPHSAYPAGYHCDPRQPLPFAGLASQKNHMSVYLCAGYSAEGEPWRWFRDAWSKTGKKLDMGKACIRFKKLDDLALDVIAEAIRRTPAKKFVEQYESARNAAKPGRRTSGTARASAARPKRAAAKSKRAAAKPARNKTASKPAVRRTTASKKRAAARR